MSLAVLSEGKLIPSREGDVRNPAPVATTGPDGRFSIQATVPLAPGEPRLPSSHDTMIVVHDRFFGKVDLREVGKAPTIKVEPWGRIEGMLKAGGQSTAGMPIGYVFARSGRSDMGSVVVGRGATTLDARGRFAFDRVAPGVVRIEQKTGAVRDLRGSVRGVFAFVKAGETTKVVLVESGRSVVGRVAPPVGIDLGADPAGVTDVAIESDGPDPSEEYKKPANFDVLSPQEKIREIEKEIESLRSRSASSTLDGLGEERPTKWWEALHRPADDGRRWVRVGRAAIDRDLRFRVDDLPPGPYRIKVVVRAGVGAEGTGRFQVPESPPGKADAPIDLGVLKLLPNRPPAASP